MAVLVVEDEFVGLGRFWCGMEGWCGCGKGGEGLLKFVVVLMGLTFALVVTDGCW